MLAAQDYENLTVTLAITGASGSLFAAEALRQMEADTRVARIPLVVSPSALRVLAEELAVNGRQQLAEKLLGRPTTKVLPLAHEDIGASVASGSYPVHAMIILPCSMGTLAGIAHGLAGNLIERAADVCLKERRPLVLCTRETPLNLIHLRNMASVTEAGAAVFPVTPTFYNGPGNIEEVVRNFVHRVLQFIGLSQPGSYQWGAPPPEA